MDFLQLENFLWASGLVLNVCLLAVLVKRSRVREYPIFSSLIIFLILQTVFLFAISRLGSERLYERATIVLGCVGYCLQCLLVFEIARKVLSPKGTWVLGARSLLIVWFAASTFIAAGVALTIPSHHLNGYQLWELRGDLFTSLLVGQLFLWMTMIANRFGLMWRNHLVALGRGFACWILFSTVADAVYAALGTERTRAMTAQVVVYLAVLLFWSISLWFPERERESLPTNAERFLLAFHRRVN